MKIYRCYNGVILTATADVFALVCRMFMWHTDWNWYETWYGVMLLNSTYFATLILLLHRLNPNAFEWDSQSKCKFLRSSTVATPRKCAIKRIGQWFCKTVLTVWFSLSSLSMPWPIEEIYDEDTITATTVKIVILTASGEHWVTAKTELEAND